MNYSIPLIEHIYSYHILTIIFMISIMYEPMDMIPDDNSHNVFSTPQSSGGVATLVDAHRQRQPWQLAIPLLRGMIEGFGEVGF